MLVSAADWGVAAGGSYTPPDSAQLTKPDVKQIKEECKYLGLLGLSAIPPVFNTLHAESTLCAIALWVSPEQLHSPYDQMCCSHSPLLLLCVVVAHAMDPSGSHYLAPMHS